MEIAYFCEGRVEYLCNIRKKFGLRQVKRQLYELRMLVSSINPYDAIGDQVIYRHKIASNLFHNIMSYTCHSFPHVLDGGRHARTGMPVAVSAVSSDLKSAKSQPGGTRRYLPIQVVTGGTGQTSGGCCLC